MSGVSTATVATSALVASAAGTAVSAYGAYQQGQSAKAQGAYQSAVLRNNQILAERAATDSEQRGKIAADQRAQQGKALIGKQRAVLAANGVDVNSGSAVDIQSDTAAENQYDALVIRSNAEREALGYRTQGMNFGSSAELATLKGESAASAGMFSAGSSLLTGAGSVASKWYEMGRLGAFNSPSQTG